MNNKFIAVLTASAVFLSIFTLTSCNKINQFETDDESLTTESYEAVEISELPTKTKDILKLFNKSLENVGTYTNTYTQNIKREFPEIDVGTFSNIPNAVDSFKVMFGETNINHYFEKEKSKKDFSNALPKGNLSHGDVSSAKAVQNGDSVYITVELKNINNPYVEDSIAYICNDYMSVDSVNDGLTDFSAEATDTTLSISNISAVLQLNCKTSKIEKYTVTFNEQFTLTEVSLQDITGKNVTAKSEVKIEYDNFS